MANVYVSHAVRQAWISQFAAEVPGQVVASRFQQEKIGMELFLKFFQSQEVGRDVLADGGMRAAAGLDGADSLGLEGGANYCAKTKVGPVPKSKGTPASSEVARTGSGPSHVRAGEWVRSTHWRCVDLQTTIFQ
jgi:hypothetical protein